MAKSVDNRLPFLAPEEGDTEIEGLIETWRYHGPSVQWDDIVGHEAQIQRCKELVEKLRRGPDDLARLRLRVGAGLVITGPTGVGKSLMARALATAMGRDVVIPPTSELAAETIRRLYDQLTREERPVVVVLDEAETLIGGTWSPGLDPAGQKALLAALDGIQRTEGSPITVAITTTPAEQLEPAAIRPGRLAPRLVLEPPSPEERAALLTRTLAGLPTKGDVAVETVIDRTVGWTGAELLSAVEEACSRSLIDRTDALREDLLLQVIAERYVIRDLPQEDDAVSLRVAVHEAGHVLYGFLTFPGAIASVQLRGGTGSTRLSDGFELRVRDSGRTLKLAEMALAGDVAEVVVFGPGGRSEGSENDKARATQLVWGHVQASKPYAPGVLEQGLMSDRGSERMRAGWHAEVEQLASDAHGQVLRALSRHQAGLLRLANAILEADDHELSGPALEAAIEAALPGAVSGLYGEHESGLREGNR
jgi:SpoVK/Ycf46/Vps4 family AAA+-type ATPase